MKLNATLVGVVLAGGQARRMGGADKALVRLAGRPLLAHVIDALGPQTDRLIINANGDPARFAEYDLPVVADGTENDAGPLAGILAALRWTAEHEGDQAWVLSAPVDTPFLPETLGERLLRALSHVSGSIAVAATDGRRHPVAGLWHVAIAADIKTAIQSGQRSVEDFVVQHGGATVSFPMGKADDEVFDPFLNINTPGDLAKAEALYAALKGHGGRV